MPDAPPAEGAALGPGEIDGTARTSLPDRPADIRRVVVAWDLLQPFERSSILSIVRLAEHRRARPSR